jgi:hypothetical protein
MALCLLSFYKSDTLQYMAVRIHGKSASVVMHQRLALLPLVVFGRLIRRVSKGTFQKSYVILSGIWTIGLSPRKHQGTDGNGHPERRRKQRLDDLLPESRTATTAATSVKDARRKSGDGFEPPILWGIVQWS